MNKEAMKLALEALEAMQSYAAAERKGLRICDEAITALREALAEQPAQRTWVGLMDEETGHWAADFLAGAKWAEAKLKEKNNGN